MQTRMVQVFPTDFPVLLRDILFNSLVDSLLLGLQQPSPANSKALRTACSWSTVMECCGILSVRISLHDTVAMTRRPRSFAT
jgi:hypothetical protein